MGSRTSSSGPTVADPNGSLSGASYVVFGRNTVQSDPFPASLEPLEPRWHERLSPGRRRGRVTARASAVSSAGDVNGDGLADLLIGAAFADPNGSLSGASYVVFGRNTVQSGPFPASLNLSDLDGTNGFRLNGVAPCDRSGFAVSSAGDVNGDGIADLLIGAAFADPNGSYSGASYVVFGRNTAQTGPFAASLNLSDLDGTNGFRLDGVAAGDCSGLAVSGAGDVNGDGLADLLIGADGADPNGIDSGASYVVFGRNTAQTGPFAASLNLSDLDGTNGFRLTGVATGDCSGRAVSTCGGCQRRWARGPPHRGPRRRPQRQLFRGELCGLRAEHRPDRPLPGEPQPLESSMARTAFASNGVAAGDLSGRAVSGAGDVNGDGLADLLIGAFVADPNGVSSGASYVVFGRNTAQTGPFPASLNLSSLDGTNGFRLIGVAGVDLSGGAVSSAGDVNGDGGADLLIGADFADPNGTNSGASYVVFGGHHHHRHRHHRRHRHRRRAPATACPSRSRAPTTARPSTGPPATTSSTDRVATTCSAAEAATTSSAAVTAEIGSSAARAATGCSAAQAATSCSARRAEMR